ncbi:hypothetical protein N9189_02800 [Pirellulaceae bacterium]|nr:hypothetical protein [Pirellulaceae bacterium]
MPVRSMASEFWLGSNSIYSSRFNLTKWPPWTVKSVTKSKASQSQKRHKVKSVTEENKSAKAQFLYLPT